MAVKIVELVNLTKKYGSQTVVDNLNLAISRGEIYGLMGPNGAGKTTAILMMLGLAEPDSGFVKVCGIDSTTNPIEVKKHVGYLPEDVGFYDDYTGLENLIYIARLNGIAEKEARHKAGQLLIRVGLSEEAKKKTGKYSRGMRQRLGLADVLIKNPEVIILDEPTLGIDPTGVQEFLQLIIKLSKEEGLTVLLSSHYLHQVQQVCDRVGLFIGGKMLAEGDIQSLSEQLFANSPYTIEAGISHAPDYTSGHPGEKYTTDWLKQTLQHIDGIVAVTLKNGIFHIECSLDVTPDIARAIVQSGAGLNYLNKKEYGLNDIYNRYFEGGINNE